MNEREGILKIDSLQRREDHPDDEIIRDFESLEHISPEDLRMYDVPGFAPVTPGDLETYKLTRIAILQKINSEFLAKSLEDNDWDAAFQAAEMFQFADPLVQEKLQPLLLRFIKDSIKTKSLDWERASQVLHLLDGVAEEEKNELQALLPPLILESRESDTFEIMHAGAQMIRYAPENTRAELIATSLEHPNWVVRSNGALMIRYASIEARASLIEKCFENADTDTWLEGAKMIEHAPLERQPQLRRAVVEAIRKGLVSTNLDGPLEAARLIEYAPENDQESLRASLIDLVHNGLGDEDMKVRFRAIRIIEHAPENSRAALIREAFEKIDEPKFYKVLTQMIAYAPEAEQARLYDFTIPKLTYLSNPHKLALQTSLYDKYPDPFATKDFEKTGSKLTLLDQVPGDPENSLRNRVIIRHVDFTPYMAWTKAFEEYAFWKKKGFEYVPIEPIIRSSWQKSKIAVFSRTLGVSVGTWVANTPLFRKEIMSQVEAITTSLKELDIEHGHLHLRNFCLMFDKSEDGSMDITRAPRVYAIDFDQAVSPGSSDSV